MKNAFLIFSFFIWAASVFARDFGIQGHVYQISEPDLLKQILRKLFQLREDSTLNQHHKLILKRVQKNIHRPLPVSSITHTQEQREFFYDPSFKVPFDLKDHKGKIFQKKGTCINPLTYRSLNHLLIFIDGEDERQVIWADKTYKEEKQKAKVILIAGSPFDLMEAWNHPVYFDQEGRITKKLGIKHVPAVVKQEGLHLKITEIKLNEEKS